MIVISIVIIAYINLYILSSPQESSFSMMIFSGCEELGVGAMSPKGGVDRCWRSRKDPTKDAVLSLGLEFEPVS